MNDRFKLVVFDWDGTLMDSAARIVACVHAAADDVELPRRSDAQVRDIIGLGLHEAIRALFPHVDDGQLAQLAERYRYHFLTGNDTPSQPFASAGPTLSRLSAHGYLLAVATGKGRRGLDRALQETGFAALFHASRCADETRSKPHPQMLLELMDELGVEPRETLMVGDTEYDLLMAGNAGVAALGVSYGVHERERLLRCNALGCVDDLAELADRLCPPGPSASGII